MGYMPRARRVGFVSRIGHSTVYRMVHKGITEPVAASVRQAIEASGLSKRQVAIRSGLAPTTLDRKISGRTDFTLSELHALSGALGVTVSSLIPSGLDAVA